MNVRAVVFLLLLTAAGLLIHGYHLGAEDQAIYLPSIKMKLDPGLYPYDAPFFLAQTTPALFDGLIAVSIQATGLRLDVAVLLWHALSIFLFLLGCWQLARRCFVLPSAQWAAVITMTVLLTLPVAGTLLTVTDEYLHPRNLATAALLFALVAVIDRSTTAVLWLFLSALLHPQMAFYGAFHLLFQAWRMPEQQRAALLFPPLLGPYSNKAWHEVMLTRTHHFPLQWRWYELFGAFAPLLLLNWFARIGRQRGDDLLAHLSGRLTLSGSVGVAGAILISVLPGFEPLIPTQPMRTLHLVYIVCFLLAGGLLGQWFLRDRPLRWASCFLPIAALLCCHQLQLYPSSPHLEWPGRLARNDWVQAFDWIRTNTPRTALFALDPRHMERPGEDFHGFRALAERSMLADDVKDRGVSALFPSLAPTCQSQIRDEENWRDFRLADFRRLKEKYGVSWVVLERPGVPELPCPYANQTVMVCRVL
jgi:hypothetical protein